MASPNGRAASGRAEIAIGALGFLFGSLLLAFYLFVCGRFEVIEGEVVYACSSAWAFDVEAYLRAANRLVTDGSLYLRELVEAPFVPGGKDYFYYAPPLGVALLPLSDIAEYHAAAIWYVLKSLALVLACLLMPVRLPVRALTFLGAVFSFWALRDLILGNVGVLLVLPMVMAWRWLDRPLGSIGLAVAMSVRPSTGALLIWQLLRRQWRVAAWTIAAGITLLVLTLPFVGIDGYREYFTVVGNIVTPGAGSENRDLGATAVSLGLDERWIDLVRFGSIALGAVLMLLGLRRDRELGFMITLAASTLMIPLVWDHHLLLLALPLALLADRWRPIVLLVFFLSWLPSAFSSLVPLLTLALLFLLPTRPHPMRPVPHVTTEAAV